MIKSHSNLSEPTFETLHKIRNEIKENAKPVYSNIWGGPYGHISLVLTDVQYALISPTPFVYPTHPGPLVIPDGKNAHANSNMRIAHTNKVRLLQEVTGVKQALVHKLVATIEEEYLVDIFNLTTNSINNTVSDVLTQLQDNCG